MTGGSYLIYGGYMEFENIKASVKYVNRPRISGLFVQGPLSFENLCLAGKCPGKALHLYMVVHLHASLNKRRGGNSFRLQPIRWREMGISRQACYRGLRSLVTAGLISVTKGPGSSTYIQLIRNN